MAKTKLHNPLDQFNSYSIHYIMLACRTTEDAKVFTDKEKEVETLRAIEQVSLLGEPIPYGDTKDVAFLVMDTRRFSQFTVEKLKYETLVNGLEKGNAPSNLVTTVEMTILDSVGVSFINFLQWLMDAKMQCNFDGMIYMLRVIFVGHRPDGTTSGIADGKSYNTTVQSITIPMHLLKLELNLDYAKGAYTAEFMPNINFDAKQNSRWLNIGTAGQYVTKDNTLGGMIDSFEAELNKRSRTYFDKASELLAARGSTATNNAGKYGRLVQYAITIPKEWQKMKVAGRASGNSTETDYTKADSAGKPTETNMSVEAGMLIPDVLDRMFKQVPEIADLGNGRKSAGTGGSVSFYKHMIGITSDNNTVIVHVDVVPFRVPNVIADQSKQTIAPGDDQFYQKTQDGTRIPREYMEFDYIFTGKNTTILNFDMKLQNLQWMLASNLEIGAGAMQEQSLLGQDGKKKPINTAAELVTSRPYDALLMPKNSQDELNNFSAYSSLILKSEEGKKLMAARQDYTRNLSAFYASSPITVVMTIKGNPDIMAKFNVGTFMDHISSSTNLEGGAVSATNTSVKQKYREDLEKRIIKDNTSTVAGQSVEELGVENGTVVVKSLGNTSYSATPVFVKVNINGPNVNFRTSDIVKGEDFSKEILNNNYYVVFKVTNTIEGGLFTQDLELWSHNVFGNGKISGPPDKTIATKT